MSVPKVTALEFQDRIRRSINDRNSTYDTAYGPIPDLVINPVAAVLEEQNDRLRRVSLLLSLANEEVFEDADVDALVFNEGMVRSGGAQAVGTVVFRKRTAPVRDITVARGFPIGTSPDEASGNAVTFVTSETRTLVRGTGFNDVTGFYELEVPVVCVVEGEDGRVGPSRINRPLRPLVEFDAVTNPRPTSGGRARETNKELAERYLIAIIGTQLNTPFGAERHIRDNFPDVLDALIVYGTNPLLTRNGSDAGAVDAYIKGTQALTSVENLVFGGVGQLMAVGLPPLIEVDAVGAFIEGTDYEVVLDTTGNAGSVRAVEGIRFLTGGTAPTLGTTVNVTYSHNQLIRTIQADNDSRDVVCLGRDLLVKQGLRVSIFLDARLKVLSGFNFGTVSGFVVDTLLTFINDTLGLGDDVEVSDLQAEVRRLSGVDNFIIDRLVREAVAVGDTDVTILDNEYPSIVNPGLDLNITAL